MTRRCDSRGGSWWGWEAACVKEFDRKGLERSCPWSGVKPPTTSFLCHISLRVSTWSASVAQAWFIFLWCPRISCELPFNKASQLVTRFTEALFQRTLRTQLFVQTQAACKCSRFAGGERDLLSEWSLWERTTNSPFLSVFHPISQVWRWKRALHVLHG